MNTNPIDGPYTMSAEYPLSPDKQPQPQAPISTNVTKKPDTMQKSQKMGKKGKQPVMKAAGKMSQDKKIDVITGQ